VDLGIAISVERTTSREKRDVGTVKLGREECGKILGLKSKSLLLKMGSLL
jgi:hypothetical protein